MPDTNNPTYIKEEDYYGFIFSTKNSVVNKLKEKLEFDIVDKLATVINILFSYFPVDKTTNIEVIEDNVASNPNCSGVYILPNTG